MNDSLTRTNRPDSTFQFSLVRLVRIVRSPRLDSQTHPLVADAGARVAVHSLTVLSVEEPGMGNNTGHEVCHGQARIQDADAGSWCFK